MGQCPAQRGSVGGAAGTALLGGVPRRGGTRKRMHRVRISGIFLTLRVNRIPRSGLSLTARRISPPGTNRTRGAPDARDPPWLRGPAHRTDRRHHRRPVRGHRPADLRRGRPGREADRRPARERHRGVRRPGRRAPRRRPVLHEPGPQPLPALRHPGHHRVPHLGRGRRAQRGRRRGQGPRTARRPRPLRRGPAERHTRRLRQMATGDRTSPGSAASCPRRAAGTPRSTY